MTGNIIAWAVMAELRQTWCEHPCNYREGCGCADAIQIAIDAAIAAENEACAKVAEGLVDDVRPIPCPDGNTGCLVLHQEPYKRPRTRAEIASAIRFRRTG